MEILALRIRTVLAVILVIVHVTLFLFLIYYFIWWNRETDLTFQAMTIERVQSMAYLQTEVGEVDTNLAGLMLRTRNNYQTYKYLVSMENSNLKYVQKFKPDEYEQELQAATDFYEALKKECEGLSYIERVAWFYEDGEVDIRPYNNMETFDNVAKENISPVWLISLSITGLGSIILLIACSISLTKARRQELMIE